jgi:hypothetical protein
MKPENAGRRLPLEFASLDPFVEDWALPTEAQRYEKREHSNIEEIQRFYDAVLPRAEAALDYLDRFSLDAMPDEAKHLMYLLHSLATVSFCVEFWKQPKVVDSGMAMFNSINEPLPV